MTPTPIDVDVFEHASGLTTIFQHNDAAPVVALQMWVRVGSGDETDAEAGLAHVHEHMLFKGTERRAVGEIARDIEAIGGSINAWTSFDETVYHVVVPSRFVTATGLDVLLDAVTGSAFEAGELERELEVIQEEIRRGEDMPTRMLSQALFATVYGEHAYGRPVIGTSASVASFERDDVLRFYERWYRPDNMTLVVVGDIDRGEVSETLDRFWPRGASAATKRGTRTPEPEQRGPRGVLVHRDVNEAHVQIAFRAPDLAAEDTPALELLSILLGQGESSILFEQVQRREQLATDVFAALYAPREPGIMLAGASFPARGDAAGDPLAVIEAVAREVAVLQHRLLSRADVARALAILESDMVYQRQTVQGVAQRFGYFHTVAGGVEFEQRFLELARRVSPADLRSVARRYLRPESMTVAVLLPSELETSGPTREAVVEAATSVFAELGAELGALEIDVDAHGIVRHEFENGLVALVVRDTTAPMFAMRAAVMGGLLLEGEADNGVSNLLANLFSSGTHNHTASALALEVDSMAASMAGFSGRNTIGMRMTALSRDFEPAVELFAEALFDSTAPDDELERMRRETIAQIAAQEDHLAGQAFRSFAEQAYAGHPYERPVIGTPDSVGGLSREEILEFYHRAVRPERMVVAVVGDVDPERALRAIGASFQRDGDGAPRVPSGYDAPPEVAEPIRLEQERERNQAHVVLGWQTESMFGAHRAALDVLGAVLAGQGGRLFVELRDRRSLAYTVSAFANAGYDAGTFTMYIATGAAKLDEAVAELRRVAAEVVADGITDEELLRAQRYLLGRRDIALQRHSARAGYLVFDDLYGLGYDHGFGYGDRIEAVTPEEVRTAAAAYLRPEREILSIFRPPAGFEGDVPEGGSP